MSWISGQSDRVEEAEARQRRADDFRYNMLHGEHGLFAVGENLNDKLASLTPKQRDTLAKSVESCSAKIRREAGTQGGMVNRELSAVADKVDKAAGQLRDGEFKGAQKTLVSGATQAAAAGYPGISEEVTTAGTSTLNALTSMPLIPPVDQLLDKNTAPLDLPAPSPQQVGFGGIDYGTLG